VETSNVLTVGNGKRQRPDHDEYFMRIAMAVRLRANCIGLKVGAVIALDDRLISAGYNGTPSHMPNCDEGGCYRCGHRDDPAFKSGTGYDVCICVHAEQNALMSAARFGIPVQGATLFTTSRPCFGCTKEMLQAQIHAVYFVHDWKHPNADLQQEYERLQNAFGGRGGIRQLKIDDPDQEWAVPARAAVPDDTGHEMPDGAGEMPDLSARLPVTPRTEDTPDA